MFGYVIVNKPELKIKDYEHYREYYCGICHSLQKNYGLKGQAVLSYDATFVAVLLTALYEPETVTGERNCIVHPGKKKYLQNAIIDYVSDMNLILSYYKCLDDWNDDKNGIKLAFSGIIRKSVKRAASRYPEKTLVLRNCLKKQQELEKSGNTNIDELAAPTGGIMSEILDMDVGKVCSGQALQPGDFGSELRMLGMQLGKFIYILDAFDDVKEDIKKGSFNPFSNQYRLAEETDTVERFKEEVKNLLMMVAADMAKAYEKLPIVEEVDILRNIIYSGIWSSFYSIGEKGRKL